MPARRSPDRRRRPRTVAALAMLVLGSSAGPRDSAFTVPTGPLTEISGCARSTDENRVWLHNDSGSAPTLYALDLATKRVRPVAVDDADAVDWEDLAPLPGGGLLIGDIGDNNKRRKRVTLYRVDDPGERSRVAATAVALQYTDGRHNAEALVVDPETAVAYVLTKASTGVSGVYRATGKRLQKIGSIRIRRELFIQPNQITAADALPDGSGVVVRTYQAGYLLRRAPGAAFESAFAAEPVRFELPIMRQAEALCVLPDGTRVLTTTESRGATALPFAIVGLPEPVR